MTNIEAVVVIVFMGLVGFFVYLVFAKNYLVSEDSFTPTYQPKDYLKHLSYSNQNIEDKVDYGGKLNKITFLGNHSILIVGYGAKSKSDKKFKKYLNLRSSLEEAIYTIITSNPDYKAEYSRLLSSYFTKHRLVCSKKSVKSAKKILLRILSFDTNNSYTELIRFLKSI